MCDHGHACNKCCQHPLVTINGTNDAKSNKEPFSNVDLPDCSNSERSNIELLRSRHLDIFKAKLR